MKKIILALLIYALPALLTAQTAAQKIYDLTPGNGTDAGFAVYPVPGETGYAIFGILNGGGLASRFYMLRIDRDGNQLWLKTYGDGLVSQSIWRGVLPTAKGWVLAGEKNDVGQLWALDFKGNVLWEASAPGHGEFLDLAILPTGGYLATSRINGQVSMARISAGGALEWSKYYALEGEPYSLCLSPNGGSCFLVVEENLLKIRTQDGTLVWNKKATPTDVKPTDGLVVSTLYDIVSLGDGRFATIGTLYNLGSSTAYSGYSVMLWKESGQLIWEKTFHYAELLDETNEAYAIGYLPNSKDLLLSGTIAGKTNVIRIDDKGEMVAELNLDLPGYNVLPFTYKDGGNYLITGFIGAGGKQTFFYRSAGNSLALAAPPNIFTDLPTPIAGQLLLHPNPATDLTTLVFESATEQEVRFRVLDASGRIAWENWQPVTVGVNRIELDVSQLPAGPYWLSAPATGLPARAMVKR